MEYAASLTACAPLENDRANAHLTQERITHDQRTARLNITRLRKKDLMENLQTEQRHVIEMASEKGASNWLTALQLKRYGFTLTKAEFRDGLYIRYNIEAKNTPINCPCGEKFTLSHALHCAKGGGYTHMRHIEIRDTFDKIMHDVCFDVEVERTLQLLQGESFIHITTSTDKNPRLDIKTNGLWRSWFSGYFFDAKIFNPFAKSCPKNSVEAYKYHV